MMNLESEEFLEYKLNMKKAAYDTDSSEGSSIRHMEFYQHRDMSMAAESTFYGGASLADKLRTAASEGDLQRVEDLLNKGADFAPDREGRTAIHYAALNGNGAVITMLTNAGCDIDAQDNLGYTALHRAAAQGHLEAIHGLLQEGCVLDRQDDVHGNAALHEAAWNGYSQTLEILITNKANVHLVNKAGFSALHLAAQNGHNQSARVILYAAADANLKNNYGDTPMHTSVRYGHAGVTRILVSAHCKIDEQNKNGDTGLHIAAALKRRKIAKLLTESGVNINLRNKQNETAADVARRKAHPEIVDTIVSQSKLLKAKKKLRKKAGKAESKLVVNLPEDGEKKEKKGFFFKKKNRNKDKKTSGSSIEVKTQEEEEEEDFKNFRNFKAPVPPRSDASSKSSEFTSNPASQEMKIHELNHPKGGIQARGTSTGPPQTRVGEAGVDSKKGYLSQYVPKQGVQYYKDLAGNVKQGPIGYTPVCTCGPQLKKLEDKMSADRDNIYDHIGHTHKMITEQMNKLDQKCSQQIFTFEKNARGHRDADRQYHEQWLNGRLQSERQQWDTHWDKKHRYTKNETQFNVDMKLTAFEKQYGHQNCAGCESCKQRQRTNQGPLDDDYVNYTGDDAPLPGALVRSKSDETLSVSSSHPGKKSWKARSRAMKELKDMHLAKVSHRAHRIENELRGGSRKTRQHKQQAAAAMSEDEYLNKRSTPPGAPQPAYDVSGKRPSGRSPEGQAEVNYTEKPQAPVPPVQGYGMWGVKRQPVNSGLLREFEEAEGNDYPKNSLSDIKKDFESLKVHDQPAHQRPGMTKSKSGPEGLTPPGPKASTPNIIHTQVIGTGCVPAECHPNTPYTPYNATPNSYTSTPKGYNSTGSSINVDSPSTLSFNNFASPENVQLQNTKVGHATDSSSSNQDSGYVNQFLRPASGRSNSSTATSIPEQQNTSSELHSNQASGMESDASHSRGHPYYRNIMTEWYGQKAGGPGDRKQGVENNRPVQGPPLGYGQPVLTTGTKMYNGNMPQKTVYYQGQGSSQMRQEPQPQVPSTSQQSDAFVSGKATQV